MKRALLFSFLLGILINVHGQDLKKWGSLGDYTIYTESSKSFENSSITYSDGYNNIASIQKIKVFDGSNLVTDVVPAQELVKQLERKYLIDYYLANNTDYIRNEWIYEKDIYEYYDPSVSDQKFYLPSGSIGEADPDFIDYVVNRVVKGAFLSGATTSGLNNYDRRVSVYKDLIFTTIVPESGGFDDFQNEMDKEYGDIIDEVFRYTEINSGDAGVVDFKEAIGKFYAGLGSKYEIILKRNPTTKGKIFARKVKEISDYLEVAGDVITVGNVASGIYRNVVNILLIKTFQESEAEYRLDCWNRISTNYSNIIDPALKEAISEADFELKEYFNESILKLILEDYLSDPDTYISSAFYLAEKLSSKISAKIVAAKLSVSVAACVGPALLIGQVAYETWKILNEGDRMFEAVVASATIERNLMACTPLSISSSEDYEYISVINNIRQLLTYFFYVNMHDRLDQLGWYGEWIASLKGTPMEEYSAYEDYLLAHKNIIVPQIQAFRPDFYPRNKSQFYALFEKISVEGQISLKDGLVNKPNGTTSDIFSFSVNYNDESGQEPQSVTLVVDGNSYAMAGSGSVSDKVTYRKDHSFSSQGTKYFHFVAIAADGETTLRYPDQGELSISIEDEPIPTGGITLEAIPTSYYAGQTENVTIETTPSTSGVVMSCSSSNSSVVRVEMLDGGISNDFGKSYMLLTAVSPGTAAITCNATNFGSKTVTINVKERNTSSYVNFQASYNSEVNGEMKIDLRFYLDENSGIDFNYTVTTSNGHFDNNQQIISDNQDRTIDESVYCPNEELTEVTITVNNTDYTFYFFPQKNASHPELKSYAEISDNHGSFYNLDWGIKNNERTLFLGDRDYVRTISSDLINESESERYDNVYALAVSQDNTRIIAWCGDKLRCLDVNDFALLESVDHSAYNSRRLLETNGSNRYIVGYKNPEAFSIVDGYLTRKSFSGDLYADELTDIASNPVNNDFAISFDNDAGENEVIIYNQSGSKLKDINISRGNNESSSLAFSPNGQLIVADRDNENLKLYSSSYQLDYLIPLFGEYVRSIEWNPNSSYNYVAAKTLTKLYILDMDNNGKIISVWNDLDNMYSDLRMKWSNDGKVLAFVSGDDKIMLFSPFDQEGPEITISPGGDAITSTGNSLNLSITLSDKNELLKTEVYMNDVPITTNTESSFVQNLSLTQTNNAVKIIATDEFYNSTIKEINIRKTDNLKPIIVKTIQDISMNVGASMEVGCLSEYFSDAENDQLTFKIESSSTTVRFNFIEENSDSVLIIRTSKDFNESVVVSVSASDGVNDPVSFSFNVNLNSCSPTWATTTYTNSTTAYAKVTIKEIPAEAGDKIAAFVGDECRGIADVLVDNGVAYATVIISGDSPETVTFKIWDASECAELDACGTWTGSPGGNIGYPPNYLEVNYCSELTQTVNLPNNGWNLASFYVDLSDKAMSEIFTGNPCGVMQVKDMTRSWDPAVPNFLNTLTSVQCGEGYFINAVSSCAFDVTGPICGDVTIPLNNDGWNLIGYPQAICQAVEPAFNELLAIDRLLQVKNMTLSYDPAVPTFLNTLTTVEPGGGYFVNITTAHPGFQFPKSMGCTKAAEISPVCECDWQFTGYEKSMVAYGEITLNKVPVQDNAHIGAFVGDECRAVVPLIQHDGKSYASMVINGDKKEKVSFRLSANGKIYQSATTIVTQPNGSLQAILPIDFGVEGDFNEALLKVYPNPFKSNLKIQVRLAVQDDISIKVYGADSRLIRVFEKEKALAGEHQFEWNAKDASGRACAPGMYYIQLNGKTVNCVEKVILNKK